MLRKSKKQNGNALFLILIAVALFAALSYAVTQSGRGGSGVDREQAVLDASTIIQRLSNIEQTVLRLRITGGCNVNTLSFHHDSNGNGTLDTDGSDDYYNPNSPTDFSCHVFQPNGGGLTYETPDNDWLDASFTAEAEHGEMTFNSINALRERGTSLSETIVFIPYIDRQICIEINNNLGVDNPSGNPPDEASASGIIVGLPHNVGNGGTIIDGTDNALTGCYEGGINPAEGFHLYHTLFTN